VDHQHVSGELINIGIKITFLHLRHIPMLYFVLHYHEVIFSSKFSFVQTVFYF